MIGTLLELATSLPAIAASGGLSAVALLAPRLGLVKDLGTVFARIVGVGALLLVAFAGGYRTADQAAELANAKAHAAGLQRELDNQKTVAAFASSERDRLSAERAVLKQKVDRYALLNTSRPGGDACALTDADLRFRRSLLAHKRKR